MFLISPKDKVQPLFSFLCCIGRQVLPIFDKLLSWRALSSVNSTVKNALLCGTFFNRNIYDGYFHISFDILFSRGLVDKGRTLVPAMILVPNHR